MASDSADATFRPLYAPAIQEATQSGDVEAMRAMERDAQAHLEQVQQALAELRSALQRHNS
jgi:uncharacterized protein YceH (UPF0502 family)